MTFNTDTITKTFDDAATTVDTIWTNVASITPPPGDRLLSRLGDVNVELIRQWGRVTVRSFEIVEGVVRFIDERSSSVSSNTAARADRIGDTVESAVDNVVTEIRSGANSVRARVAAEADGASSELETEADSVVDYVADAAEEAVIATDKAVEETAEAGTTPSGPYEKWTKDELYERAQEIDLDGRSTMNKKELISALRNA